VSVFEFADRAFEKTQAERRVAGKQSRNRRAVDMTHHARTQRFGTGLVFAAGEE
jgi:hypothetical protein